MNMNTVNAECFEDIRMKIETTKVRPVMPEYWKEVRLDAQKYFCPYCGAVILEGEDDKEVL